jgi:hypothetical protein
LRRHSDGGKFLIHLLGNLVSNSTLFTIYNIWISDLNPRITIADFEKAAINAFSFAFSEVKWK